MAARPAGPRLRPARRRAGARCSWAGGSGSSRSPRCRQRCPAPALLGFRDAAHAAGAALLDDVTLATDDGSSGHRGLVTELLDARLDEDDAVELYACGPPAMLESVRRTSVERGVPAQLALEAGMACGFGACFGCVVPTHDGYVRTCVDGPVLPAAELEAVPVP